MLSRVAVGDAAFGPEIGSRLPTPFQPLGLVSELAQALLEVGPQGVAIDRLSANGARGQLPGPAHSFLCCGEDRHQGDVAILRGVATRGAEPGQCLLSGCDLAG